LLTLCYEKQASDIVPFFERREREREGGRERRNKIKSYLIKII
jgi:hypothetical protein